MNAQLLRRFLKTHCVKMSIKQCNLASFKLEALLLADFNIG